MLSEAVFVRKANIISKVNQDFSILVVDQSRIPEATYQLSGFSARVWTLINGKRTFHQIANELGLKSMTEAELLRDIQKLVFNGLVEVKKP